MLLKPREYFPISRQLHDPFDSSTYYVQAVIRNENSNETIDTVNLTSEGNQLFVKRYQLPPDVSGEGFWISIRTRVYTDSGYTTLSENHEQILNTYLVIDRMRFTGGGGSGGGTEVDYKKIEKILTKHAEDLKKAFPKFDTAPLLDAIQGIKPTDLKPVLAAIHDLPKPVDLTPLATELVKSIGASEERIVAEVKAIDIPEPAEKPEDVDLKPVLSLVQEAVDTLKALGSIGQDANTVKSSVAEIINATKDLIYLLQKNGIEAPTKKIKSFDPLFEIKEKAQ